MLNTILTVVFVLISLLMIFVVLLQRGRGGGLVGAFGAGGGGSAFGTKTGDVFTAATVIIFVVFLFMALILNWRVGTGPKRAYGSPTTAAMQSGMGGTAPAKVPTGLSPKKTASTQP